MENYLEHHGVRGMKWGVRRYQNYDGSYTQAGLKRFNKSLGEYEKSNEQLKATKKAIKQAKKTGKEIIVGDGERTYKVPMDRNKELYKFMKEDNKKKKAQANKDYRHLKQDKLGDQGKELYARGKTITGNSQVTGILNSIGSVALSAAAYNAKSGGQVTRLIRQYTGVSIDDKQFTKVAGGVGVAALGASAAKSGVDAYQNKRLRAYYGHTSNY